MTKWCCQGAKGKASSKARGKAAASPPAPAPPPPAASGGYPAGVVAAGLQAVYDLKITAGTLRGLTVTLPSALPPGYSTLVTSVYATNGDGTAAVTIADVDGSGANVYFNGGDYTLDNFRAYCPASPGYIFAIGHGNGGPLAANLTLKNGIVDQSNLTAGDSGKIIGAAGSLTIDNVKFVNTCGRAIETFIPLTITDSYFESPGQHITPDDHNESIKFDQGTHTLARVFFDARGNAGNHTNATGLIYCEAGNGGDGDCDVTVTDSLFAGAAGIFIYSPIQAAASNGKTCTLRLNNCVLQKGDGGNPYVVPSSGTGGVVHVILTNCRDWDTGEIIDALVNPLAP